MTVEPIGACAEPYERSDCAGGERGALGDRSAEIRLGLVLYGGVSLAVYMNGVAQEFFRAVRGRGVYSLLKNITDSDIVVDIISGTSAGGINGILLAYALTNEFEFSKCARFWREHGDINKLLQNHSKGVEESYSALDSEGHYHGELKKAFRELAKHGAKNHDSESPSELKELDLFVTGTDLDGRVWTDFDDAGHPIDVKDHRAVFHIKHRSVRKTELSPCWPSKPNVMHEGLAKLSRLTSAFPGAFEPVRVDCVSKDRIERIHRQECRPCSADELLQYWGRLGRSAYFVDGGVIDNKPFTHTIKAIFSRTSERRVKRLMFYVDPDPEVIAKAKTPDRPSPDPDPPRFFKPIVASLLGLPAYESISDDLNLLKEHNARIERHKRLAMTIVRPSNTSEPPELYLQCRAARLAEGALDPLLRLESLTKLLKASPGSSPQDAPDARSVVGELIESYYELVRSYPRGDGSSGSSSACPDRESVLNRLDIYMRERRLFFVSYTIRDLVNDGEQGGSGCLIELRKRINRQIRVIEIIRASMEALVERLDVTWDELLCDGLDSSQGAARLWTGVVCAYTELLKEEEGVLPYKSSQPGTLCVTEVLSQHSLTELNCSFLNRIEEIAKVSRSYFNRRESAALEGASSVLEMTDEYERQLLEHYSKSSSKGKQIKQSYQEFERLDAVLYPAEYMGGLEEKDVIETVRLSPRDAQRGFSKRDLSEKLAGDSFFHFGGFFKKSWRSNDLLWGRLDAVCQLVESVVTPDRLQQLGQDDRLRPEIRKSMTENCMQEAFRHSPDEARRKLTKWLTNAFSEDPCERNGATKGPEFSGGLECLIEASQLEILASDLQSVLDDAIGEQLKWNQYRVPEDSPLRYQADKNAFVAPPGTIDGFVGASAAAVSARGAMKSLKKASEGDAEDPYSTRSPLGEFFAKHYKVGSESFARDIPLVIRLGILARSVLVLRNCLLNGAGELGRKLDRNRLVKLFVDLPLKLLYHWVRWWRKSPADLRYRTLAMLAVSAMALVLAMVYREAWWPAAGISWLRAAALVGTPLLLLAAGLWTLALSDTPLYHRIVGVTGWTLAAAAVVVSVCLVSDLILMLAQGTGWMGVELALVGYTFKGQSLLLAFAIVGVLLVGAGFLLGRNRDSGG